MKKHIVISTFIAVILLLTAGAVGHRLGIEQGRKEGAGMVIKSVLDEIQKTEQLTIKGLVINGISGDLILKPTEFNKYE